MTVSGFLDPHIITDVRHLFGYNKRGDLLDRLRAQVTAGASCQLLGDRSTGRSSVLRCSAKRLENDNNFVVGYVEPRLARIESYQDAYRAFVACLHTAAFARGIFTPTAPAVVNTVTLPNTALYGECSAALQLADCLYDDLFRGYVELLAQEQKGAVLMIDEYERLIEVFAGNSGFSCIRSCVQDLPSSNGIRPLTYVIAGATPWERMARALGSDELNATRVVLRTAPLDEVAFREMWDHCVRCSGKELQARIVESSRSADTAFRLAGGWPYIGKIIGHLIGTGDDAESAFYDAVSPHFAKVWKRLDPRDRNLLMASQRRATRDGDPGVDDLVLRGLLEVNDDGGVETRGGLWGRFVQERRQNRLLELPLDYGEPSPSESGHADLVRQTVHLVTSINSSAELAGTQQVFMCSNFDPTIYNALERSVYNEQEFTVFIMNAYRFVYDRTKDNAGRARGSLPAAFKNDPVVLAISHLRHYYGGHIADKRTVRVVGDVHEKYTEKRTKPLGPRFALLQTGILRDLVDWLERLEGTYV